jgi:hypothetical protein
MHAPSQDDDLLEKWKNCTAREKSVVIKAFLNEYGEDATWEQWLAFLHSKQQVKAFEWTKLVK